MLTICIPTFNRCNFLNDLLISIYNADKKAKIIVVNNCSTDNTKNVINKFKKKFKYFKYFSHKKKKTYDQNYISCLNKIKTKYGWIIGDDDLVTKDSIKKINVILKKKKNITGITCNYNLIEKQNKISKKFLKIKEFNINKEFCKLGMLSTQIINIDLFKKLKKIINLKKIIFNGYAHMSIGTYLIKYYKNWFYYENKIINYRSGNLEYFKNKNNYFFRLKNELASYSENLKILFNKQDKSFVKNMDNIYKKNMQSWLFLSMIESGKVKTIKLIKKYLNFFSLASKINITLLILTALIIPKFILIILKKIRRNIITFSN
jgi:glycosyltransferase involved in cell wall biosynthesis